jgi:hypothetical protein
MRINSTGAGRSIRHDDRSRGSWFHLGKEVQEERQNGWSTLLNRCGGRRWKRRFANREWRRSCARILASLVVSGKGLLSKSAFEGSATMSPCEIRHLVVSRRYRSVQLINLPTLRFRAIPGTSGGLQLTALGYGHLQLEKNPTSLHLTWTVGWSNRTCTAPAWHQVHHTYTSPRHEKQANVCKLRRKP